MVVRVSKTGLVCGKNRGNVGPFFGREHLTGLVGQLLGQQGDLPGAAIVMLQVAQQVGQFGCQPHRRRGGLVHCQLVGGFQQ